jgi:hypothetical protein
MAAQKITRLRHTKQVETGAGAPAPASTLSTSREMGHGVSRTP